MKKEEKYCCCWLSGISFSSVNSNKIYPEQWENRWFESAVNQNKELVSKLDDLSRKLSSLEKTISVANQFFAEGVKGGKTPQN